MREGFIVLDAGVIQRISIGRALALDSIENDAESRVGGQQSFCDMYHIFKNFQIKPVTSHNLPEVMRVFSGTPLKDVERGELLIPPTYNLHSHDGTVSIRKEFLFLDFKDAFAFFNLVASTFSRLHYHPQISNVYNRVVVSFSDPTLKAPTTKEVFLARYLFELENNPLHAASKTLQDLNSEYVI